MNNTDRIGAYRGLPLGTAKTRDEAIEELLNRIIDSSEISVPEEAVERETEYILECNLRDRRLAAMGGALTAPFFNAGGLKAQIREDVLRDCRVERVIRHIIREENLTASPEELQDYAQAMAEKEHTTLDLVRRFFGDDLTGLTSYVQKEKARALIYDTAIK